MKNIRIFLILLLLSNVVTTTYAQIKPAYWWQCDSGNTIFNFNPSVQFDSTSANFDSIPYADEYTIIVAYKAMNGAVESAVWDLQFGDSAHRGLTTQQITLDKSRIRYCEQNRSVPIVNTLQQTAPLMDSVPEWCRLNLGAHDSLPGCIKLSELMYFDQHVAQSKFRPVQSYLAIKYGVTLGPVDYVGGNGCIVWNHKHCKRHHHRITGIGCDSTYGLLQMKSRSECDSALIILSADSLGEGSYCLIGDDDGGLDFVSVGGVEYLQREWKACVTHGDTNHVDARYSITIETRLLPSDCDSLVLLIDGIPYYPDSVSADIVCYGNIRFISDTSILVFARGRDLWQASKTHSAGNMTENGEAYGRISSKIYPNPTIGQYNIAVQNTRSVSVTIYNAIGSVVTAYQDSGKTTYNFSGELPTGSVYYVTIITDDGSQTTKLIVK